MGFDMGGITVLVDGFGGEYFNAYQRFGGLDADLKSPGVWLIPSQGTGVLIGVNIAYVRVCMYWILNVGYQYRRWYQDDVGF